MLRRVYLVPAELWRVVLGAPTAACQDELLDISDGVTDPPPLMTDSTNSDDS